MKLFLTAFSLFPEVNMWLPIVSGSSGISTSPVPTQLLVSKTEFKDQIAMFIQHNFY